MGDTSSPRGGNDALEGVFGDGRKNAVCGSPASRRTDGGTLQGIRHFSQDRLQDLRSRCAVGSVPRARIGLATPAFSGPRSTNELPRHGSSLRFYGKVAALKRENGPSLLAS